MKEKDLVALVADKDMEHALKGLLSRPQSLGIRKVSADVLVHPHHDPACARNRVAFLAQFSKQYRFGLLMFDHKGSGKEEIPYKKLQEALTEEFRRTAWSTRAKAVILAPELEVCVWADSPHVDEVMGWKGKTPSLRQWLFHLKFWTEEEIKPNQPKAAFRAALRESRTPRSSSLYLQIAKKASLRRCQDPSFLELKFILQNWFPKVQ